MFSETDLAAAAHAALSTRGVADKIWSVRSIVMTRLPRNIGDLVDDCGRNEGWKGTPGFSKGESWIPAGTRGTLGSRSCRRVPLESDVNFQLKQSNRGFSFSASHLIWILASPPGIAGFRAGRPAARNPAEVVTSVLLGTHEHTRKTNCLISADQALHPVRT